MNIFNAFENKLKQLLTASDIKNKDGGLLDLSRVTVEAPRDPAHGDLATNAAMVLSKSVGQNPRQLAERIVALFSNDIDIKNISIAGPGFINLHLTDTFWKDVLKNILKSDKNYGKSLIGKGRKVNVEYVSANPTGPLHVGHCRGAVIGDVLANLLQFTGYDVTKEYYLNDAGGQIDTLASSVLLRYKQALGEDIGDIPVGLYPGEYLIPVGKMLKEEYGDRLLLLDISEAINIIKDKTIQEMVRIIRDDLAVLNIHHDLFFSERTLHANNAESIRSTINDLATKGYIYKGTLPPPKGELPDDWEDREQTLFRSTEVGDDQDRPLIKSNGAYTYFAADVAYFKDKFDRGFNEMIYVLGADHGGYVKRLEAVAKAISNGASTLSVLLCQLVKLSKNGQPITMSKRAGNFITLRDVVDEVGPDPVRFMMLYRKSDAPLDFDFAKVTEHSKENPVFYVQYASARCHSIFREAIEKFDNDIINISHYIEKIDYISNNDDIILIRKIAEFPRLIEQATLHREPHRLAFYLYDLASAFHAHWNKGLENKALRFVQIEDRNITQARLGLVQAVSTVLSIGLTIIGAEAPTEMR